MTVFLKPYQNPHPIVEPQSDAFSPWRWPPTHRHMSRNIALSAIPERTLSFSATILDNVIPAVYGTRKVVGVCGARELSEVRYVKFGFVFALGEQDSITNIKINQEDIDDCVSAGWVSSYASAVGDGSTALSAILTTITNWSADDTTLWKSLCHVAITIDRYQTEMPSNIVVTADLGGMLIDTTWRADGGSSAIASTNPVEIGYHILTNSPIWRGVDTDRVHDASWEDVAAWCEEDPGDATARWSFNGIMQHRDPDAALAEVLNHCFATPYVDFDGKLRLWAEMPPPAITGEWSASGTTVTEDSTAGEATTELTVGDMVYVGSSLRTVENITDDDTFEVDSSTTESGAKVRPISGIHIRPENWLGSLEGAEDNLNSTPDKFIVRWTDPDEWGSRETESEYGTPDADHYRRVESSFSGCTNNSMATRIGSHRLKLLWEQPYYWTAIADGTAADLEPGDVFLISDDVLTSTPVRLLPPKAILSSGGYQLSMREFDIGTYTDVTASPSTGAPAGGGWTTGVPDAPTAATQYFGYGGDWDDAGIQPDDPDDLTQAGWDATADMNVSYNGTVDATELYLEDSAGVDGYALAGWSILDSDFANNYGCSKVLMTAMVKLKDNADPDCSWTIGFQIGDSIQWSQEIDPTSEWFRVWGICEIPSGVSGAYLNFGIRADYDGTPPSSNEETIYVKRFLLIPWELDPQFSLYERWEWTEHANAASTVATYQVYVDTPSGLQAVLYEVPQGTSEFEFPVTSAGSSSGPYINVRSGYYNYDMRAHGINGVNASFPAPTQSLEVRPWAGQLATQSDVDVTDRVAGFGLSWDGTDYVHVPVARVYGSGGLTAWEDLRVSMTSTAKSGTNDPGFVQVKDNGSGSTGVFAYLFDDETEESLFFSVQLPHSYAPGTAIKPHVHWSPTSDSGGEASVIWGLEYTWANMDAAFGNTSLITGTDTGTFTADTHYVVSLGTITGTGKAESSMLLCRVYRDADNSSDDYAYDAALLEIDFHYQVEKLGTEDEYPS